MIANIQPVDIWANGQTQQATQFSLVTVYDDLETSATTYYQLLDANGAQLSQGNQTINGTEYSDWNNQPDANSWLLTWSTTQLGLTVI
jgi:hypothetical protein